MNIFKNIRYWVPAGVLLAGIFFSCTNDLDAIRQVTYDPKAPDEITKDINVYYTDSGYARVNIYAAIAETYYKPQHITKLKDSIRVDFFNEFGEVVTTLTARYGEVNYEKQVYFVKDHVHLINHADKRELFTKSLYWNQKDSTIFTNESVKVVSPKGVGYGTSINTKQDFTFYRLTHPRGKYEFND